MGKPPTSIFTWRERVQVAARAGVDPETVHRYPKTQPEKTRQIEAAMVELGLGDRRIRSIKAPITGRPDQNVTISAPIATLNSIRVTAVHIGTPPDDSDREERPDA